MKKTILLILLILLFCCSITSGSWITGSDTGEVNRYLVNNDVEDEAVAITWSDDWLINNNLWVLGYDYQLMDHPIGSTYVKNLMKNDDISSIYIHSHGGGSCLNYICASEVEDILDVRTEPLDFVLCDGCGWAQIFEWCKEDADWVLAIDGRRAFTQPTITYLEDGYSFADALEIGGISDESYCGCSEKRFPQFCGDVNYDGVINQQDLDLLDAYLAERN